MRWGTVIGLAVAGAVVLFAAQSRWHGAHWEEREDEDVEGPLSGDYWALRASYPTGHFSPAWLVEAAKQDRQIASGLPAGERPQRRTMSLSPLALDAGEITVAGQVFETGRMLVFGPGDRITVGAGPTGARLLLLGGATLEGPRYIWWNFVASSQDRIEAAKQAWLSQDRERFALPPDDRDEFIPAP